jgi:hypothetical protein
MMLKNCDTGDVHIAFSQFCTEYTPASQDTALILFLFCRKTTLIQNADI